MVSDGHIPVLLVNIQWVVAVMQGGLCIEYNAMECCILQDNYDFRYMEELRNIVKLILAAFQ